MAISYHGGTMIRRWGFPLGEGQPLAASRARGKLLPRRGGVEEGGADVKARALADSGPVRLEPILGRRPAELLQVEQEVDIGVHLAGDAEGTHLLLVADHVD